MVTQEDITERRRSDERIAHLAHYDALTDLPNRVLFREQLESGAQDGFSAASNWRCSISTSMNSRASTTRSATRSAMNLLKAVADRLRGCLRATDFVARLGGDEFAIIQTAVEQPADITDLVARIYEAHPRTL